MKKLLQEFIDWNKAAAWRKFVTLFVFIAVVGVTMTMCGKAEAATLTLKWTAPTMRCDGTPITVAEQRQMVTEIFYSTEPIPAKDVDCSIPAEAAPVGIPSFITQPGITAIQVDVPGGFTYYVRGRTSVNAEANWSNLSGQASATKDPDTPIPPPHEGDYPVYRPAMMLIDEGALAVFPPVHGTVRYESDPMIARASARWDLKFSFKTCVEEKQVLLSRDESGRNQPGHVSWAVHDPGTGCTLQFRFQSDANGTNFEGDVPITIGDHTSEFSFGPAGAIVSLDGTIFSEDPTVTWGMDQNFLPLFFNSTCWSKQDVINTCGPGLPKEPTNLLQGGWSSLQIFEE